MNQPFTFFDPGILIDDDLELVLIEKTPADPVKRWVPQYTFEMRHHGDTSALGKIRLRIGSAVKLRYAGHIGYEVNEEFRGHRYAARSCRLLFPLTYAHELRAVWLTVDPHNIPSQKTCRIIGAKYIDTVHLPKDHEMYGKGSPYRRRYRVDLNDFIVRNALLEKVIPEKHIIVNNLKLRKAIAIDSEFAYQTKKAAFKEYIDKVGGWDENEQRHLHERRFALYDFEIIQVSGTDAGILSVVRQPDCIKVNQIFILPEYQNKGIGTACMEHIIEESAISNLPVRLQVLKVNQRALAFYKRLGFNSTGETDTHVLMERMS